VATKLDILKMKVQAVLKGLENTTAKEREKHVSMHMAREFNDTLKDIGKEFPDLAWALPKEIPPHRMAGDMGASAINYIDLKIMAEQVMEILSLAASNV
jgi:hypothetical protein